MPTKDEKNQFYKEIEKVVSETKGELDWMEAISHYCNKTGMEIEVAATLINEKLKKRLEEVAVRKNLLKKKGSKLNV
jgi:hypothetical protein